MGQIKSAVNTRGDFHALMLRVEKLEELGSRAGAGCDLHGPVLVGHDGSFFSVRVQGQIVSRQPSGGSSPVPVLVPVLWRQRLRPEGRVATSLRRTSHHLVTYLLVS